MILEVKIQVEERKSSFATDHLKHLSHITCIYNSRQCMYTSKINKLFPCFVIDVKGVQINSIKNKETQERKKF